MGTLDSAVASGCPQACVRGRGCLERRDEIRSAPCGWTATSTRCAQALQGAEEPLPVARESSGSLVALSTGVPQRTLGSRQFH